MASLREALQGFEEAQIRSTTYHSTALAQVAAFIVVSAATMM
jgi:hypothetical protein